ncbi:hypothetical protein [Ornithinibacillus scapharcae]|uniref:hypothetical protein n=1 Tax=Ornithinibacillus scapharcae TaxID=1147159 RepID=UPI000225AFF5|nr:hypothetical protein [Ornithinibacillus scapharcae]
MRTLLELVRIIVLMVIFGVVCGSILNPFYTLSETAERFSFLGAIAIILLFFTLYRNKLQFTGWYKGKGREKLPKSVTRLIISSSIVLLISPFMISLLASAI